ncbi:nuclear transport factor 2 family protein [Pseudoxanthomonas putridarboris]|uniref:Nuclear transport factor 2 family protein n=1 Tax=Pseudoxanthomonas putridarboris TaxID=752605 RepID=A0ABU9J699_9GAMM
MPCKPWILLAAVLLPSMLAAQAAEPTDSIAAMSPEQLHETIRAKDVALFRAVFDTCDTALLATLVTDDLEFYHDRGGVTARSGKEFVDGVAKGCAGREAPDSWRSRRELVADSLRVYPVPGHGAMEIGTHKFYERQGDGPEKYAGVAEFSQVWRYEDGQWRVSRILSYAHR